MKMVLKNLFIIVITLVCFTTKAMAQKVEKFTINDNTYYGTKAIPEEITGVYYYEKTKEPIVDIRKDGTGLFQVHDVKAYPVEYWIETDEKGVIQKRASQSGANYQVVLILKYGSNGESGWRGDKEGQFDRIDVAMAIDMGYAISLGERYRKL
jgi:hypothetical protein